MSIVLEQVSVDGLVSVTRAVREWQYDAAPVQLHPGDIGWNQQISPEQAAAGLRAWTRDGEFLAVGMLDESVLRVAIAPDAEGDDELASRMTEDLSRPERGVLPEGDAFVESRTGTALRTALSAAGWFPDAPWTPLRRDLTEPVPDIDLRIEVLTPDRVADLVPVRVAVQRASFDKARFTEERWHAMSQSPAYADARCLIGYDAGGNAVATTTVWSAGPGRPGLIEPLGAHRDHRGHGHGRAITLAAATALRALGSSSVVVATPATNVAAVAAYVSAGFEQLPDEHDLRRHV